MKSIHFSLLIFLLLCGCSRYTLTKEQILRNHANVQIVKSGSAEGPFIESSCFVGNPDGAISVSWTTSKGVTKLEWPAEKGFAFAADGYVNSDGEVFWVLLRLPNPS
jgi:hypothetical protein